MATSKKKSKKSKKSIQNNNKNKSNQNIKKQNETVKKIEDKKVETIVEDIKDKNKNNDKIKSVKNTNSSKNSTQKTAKKNNVEKKSNETNNSVNKQKENKSSKNNKNKTGSKNKDKTQKEDLNKSKEKDEKIQKSEIINAEENKKKIEKETKDVSKEVALTEKNDTPEYVKELLRKRKAKIIISIFVIIVIVLIILFSTVFSLLNMNKTNIIDGISIKNIDVSELSKDEAKERLQEALNKELLVDLKLKYNDYEITINPSQIEFTYNIEEAVNQAYDIGRIENIVKNNYTILFSKLNGKNIDITYTYNQDLLTTFIENINSELPGVVIEPTYYMENNVLYVQKGIDGIKVPVEEMKNDIIRSFVERSYSDIVDDSYSQKLDIKINNVKASKINMAKIYEEIHTEPKDAYYETEPYKIYREVDGIDLELSVEDAQKEISKEDKNEYLFNLKITKPAKTIDDLGTEAFPYLISSFSTKYDASNINRSTNLKIAAEKINGKVLMPGEEFSFNSVVGKRTVEDGYKDAKIYADGGVVDGLAGGICQISSTLYNSVLLANLEITERKNHSYPTSYVQVGKDATVVYGVKDFKFKNSRSYPIKLEAKVNNGVTDFKIHGMSEETEYEVRILPVTTATLPFSTTYEQDATLAPGVQQVLQSGHPGYKVTTYKELRLNGAVVSKEIISNDVYEPMRTIIKVGPTQ